MSDLEIPYKELLDMVGSASNKNQSKFGRAGTVQKWVQQFGVQVGRFV